ncbi:L,D-transpeptidase [Streptomyces sp. NPDC101151]|uniref:L,D-transpeptidase n=1 Tax=Streptomyces sp. NPDC101151 TaxID=3366115 RepID=UPI003801B00A
MPEQQPPQPLTESELSARFHDLAAQGTAPVPTSGAQVRSRAVRRRRNRRVALSTTVLAAAALTVITTGVFDSHTKPATPPATSVSHTPRPAPSAAPVQRVTVDLNSRLLTVEGAKYGLDVPMAVCPIGETRVTVTAKYPTLTMPGPAGLGETSAVRRWAVTFTDGNHHERLLFWALDRSAGLNSIGHDTNSGSIALGPDTGKEVYDAIGPGTRVEIKGWQAANAQPDSLCSDRRPITGTH